MRIEVEQKYSNQESFIKRAYGLLIAFYAEILPLELKQLVKNEACF